MSEKDAWPIGDRDGDQEPARDGGENHGWARDRGREWRRARWSERHRMWQGSRGPWPGLAPGGGWAEAWGGRRPFMRRLGCLFGVFFLFTILGLGLVVWLLASALGLVVGGGPAGEAIGLAIVILLFVAAAATTFARVFRRVAGPLDELSEAASRVAGGDLAARVAVPERSPRPVRELVRSFNTMAERLAIDETQRRDLLADVSHELRTPLAVIQGNVEAMVDGIHPTDAEHLASVLEETRVLTRLVEDLRTIALAEAGTLALHREPTDVDALISEAARGFRASADRAAIGLDLDVPDDLPLAEIDPVRIREVVSNLVSNALRHTPAGGTVRVRARAKGGNALEIAVEDTGSGIEPDLVGHVFDRFAKGADSHGSGLGLAIARDLVNAHGGSIDVESEPGRGTTFRFRLPLP